MNGVHGTDEPLSSAQQEVRLSGTRGPLHYFTSGTMGAKDKRGVCHGRNLPFVTHLHWTLSPDYGVQWEGSGGEPRGPILGEAPRWPPLHIHPWAPPVLGFPLELMGSSRVTTVPAVHSGDLLGCQAKIANALPIVQSFWYPQFWMKLFAGNSCIREQLQGNKP